MARLYLGAQLPSLAFFYMCACACACGPTTPGSAVERIDGDNHNHNHNHNPEAEAMTKPEAPAIEPAHGAEHTPAEAMPTPPIPSPAMVEQILAQHVLDHPQVSPYLHSEISENLPLRVAPSPDLAQGAASLKVEGQAVVVTTADEARFVFLGRERAGPAIERIRFSIPDEGVRGHVDLELADNVWRPIDASVTER